jgi:hypothetical protein
MPSCRTCSRHCSCDKRGAAESQRATAVIVALIGAVATILVAVIGAVATIRAAMLTQPSTRSAEVPEVKKAAQDGESLQKMQPMQQGLERKALSSAPKALVREKDRVTGMPSSIDVEKDIGRVETETESPYAPRPPLRPAPLTKDTAQDYLAREQSKRQKTEVELAALQQYQAEEQNKRLQTEAVLANLKDRLAREESKRKEAEAVLTAAKQREAQERTAAVTPPSRSRNYYSNVTRNGGERVARE